MYPDFILLTINTVSSNMSKRILTLLCCAIGCKVALSLGPPRTDTVTCSFAFRKEKVNGVSQGSQCPHECLTDWTTNESSLSYFFFRWTARTLENFSDEYVCLDCNTDPPPGECHWLLVFESFVGSRLIFGISTSGNGLSKKPSSRRPRPQWCRHLHLWKLRKVLGEWCL